MLIKIRTERRCRLDELLRAELPLRLEGLEEARGSGFLIERTGKAYGGAEMQGTGGKAAPAITNSKIRRLILSGSVSVNGRECRRPAFELRGKSVVDVSFEAEKFFFEKQPDDIDFVMRECDVLFENENLIFVNKPAFLPVEQTITGNRRNLHDAVVDFLWKRQPKLRNAPYVGIMHRLDRETSGVILFTKTRAVNKAVHKMFESHSFTKVYYAVVERRASYREGSLHGVGALQEKKSLHNQVALCGQGTFHGQAALSASGGRLEMAGQFEVGQTFSVENYLGRVSAKSHAGKWGSVSEKNGGLYAKTDFKLVREVFVEGKSCWLVECTLYTGRTHQIRVHLSESGLPILGDVLYGGRAAKRIYLHAARLCAEGELKFDVTAPIAWES